MPNARSYGRNRPFEPARPSISEIRRASGLGLIAAVAIALLLVGWGVFELVAVIASRLIDHPTTGRMLPAATETLLHILQRT